MSITNFEKSIEASNGYINSIKNNIGKDKMIKILELYPNLNLEWLLTGTGEIKKEITQNTGKGHNIVGNSNKIKPPQQINDCLGLLEKKEKQLDKILNLLNQKDEQKNTNNFIASLFYVFSKNKNSKNSFGTNIYGKRRV